MTTEKIKIAIIEDDLYYNTVLYMYMKKLSQSSDFNNIEFEIKKYFNGREFVKNMDRDLDIVLLDYYLDDLDSNEPMNGAEVLKIIKDKAPNCHVIIISSQQNIVTTVELLKNGAYDYIEKGNFSVNRVWSLVQKLIIQKHELY
jgi:DNA-binding NtrC family response regulator